MALERDHPGGRRDTEDHEDDARHHEPPRGLPAELEARHDGHRVGRRAVISNRFRGGRVLPISNRLRGEGPNAGRNGQHGRLTRLFGPPPCLGCWQVRSSATIPEPGATCWVSSSKTRISGTSSMAACAGSRRSAEFRAFSSRARVGNCLMSRARALAAVRLASFRPRCRRGRRPGPRCR